MGTLTKADLRDRIGRRLRLGVEGRDLTGYESTQIDRAIDDTRQLLIARGIATWAENEIPDYLAIPLRDYVAAKNADYLATPEVAAELKAQTSALYSELVQLLRMPSAPTVLPDRVLSRMSARRNFK